MDTRMTRRGFIAAAGGAVAAAALAGCSQGQQAGASGSGSAGGGEAAGAGDSNLYFTHQKVRESPEWVKKAAEAAAEDADQLIVVAGVGKTCAYITMHEKDGGTWKQIIATPGFIGKDGMGRANCNDAYTPIGAFTIDKAFGLAADPGCAMDYTQVDGSYYWSGDARPGMHFNELVSIDDLPDLDVEESERIADYDYAYQYVLNMGYNAECVPEAGAAFFFHSFRVNRPYTGGCVAVPEDIMRFIMQHVRPGCRIALDTLESFGGDLDA